jgi:hypothetical protein
LPKDLARFGLSRAMNETISRKSSCDCGVKIITVGLALSLLLAVEEHNAGIKFQEKMHLFREKIERQYGNANSPSALQNITTTDK